MGDRRSISRTQHAMQCYDALAAAAASPGELGHNLDTEQHHTWGGFSVRLLTLSPAL